MSIATHGSTDVQTDLLERLERLKASVIQARADRDAALRDGREKAEAIIAAVGEMEALRAKCERLFREAQAAIDERDAEHELRVTAEAALAVELGRRQAGMDRLMAEVLAVPRRKGRRRKRQCGRTHETP